MPKNKTVSFHRKSSKRLPKILSSSEQSLLINSPNHKAPTGIRNKAIITLMLNSGLRVSEVLHLTDSNIDFDSGKIHVSSGKCGKDRILWLNDLTLSAILAWLEIRPLPSPFIFCTLKGGKLSDRYVRSFVKRYAIRANIKKDVHPHMLRHTFATDLLNSTGNLRLVQKALGHSCISSTQIYTHIVDKDLQFALKNFK